MAELIKTKRTEPDSSPQPTVPYAVGSKDWASIALSGKADGDTIELSEANFKSLLSVFSRVYAIAKIVCIILLNYGVEVCIPRRQSSSMLYQ